MTTKAATIITATATATAAATAPTSINRTQRQHPPTSNTTTAATTTAGTHDRHRCTHHDLDDGLHDDRDNDDLYI